MNKQNETLETNRVLQKLTKEKEQADASRREYHRKYQKNVRLADPEKRAAYNKYQREYARRNREAKKNACC